MPVILLPFLSFFFLASSNSRLLLPRLLLRLIIAAWVSHCWLVCLPPLSPQVGGQVFLNQTEISEESKMPMAKRMSQTLWCNPGDLCMIAERLEAPKTSKCAEGRKRSQFDAVSLPLLFYFKTNSNVCKMLPVHQIGVSASQCEYLTTRGSEE